MEYATLSRAPTSLSVVLNETISQSCDLTGLYLLVDIGGGEGSFLSTLLQRHPEMTGTLFVYSFLRYTVDSDDRLYR
jgi:hypothetical protein